MNTNYNDSNLGSLTRELLSSEIYDSPESPQEVCDAVGWRHTGAALLVAGVWCKAKAGDVNAAKLVRELNGENTDMDGAADLSLMSDAALFALAKSAAPETAAELSAAEGLIGSQFRETETADAQDNTEFVDDENYITDEIPW
ncbi:MAG: hypothetical protein Q4F31_10675 [Eubacteriales bacterium]|nr:hypothetical protein [Eubacteriales bacterium]